MSKIEMLSTPSRVDGSKKEVLLFKTDFMIEERHVSRGRSGYSHLRWDSVKECFGELSNPLDDLQHCGFSLPLAVECILHMNGWTMTGRCWQQGSNSNHGSDWKRGSNRFFLDIKKNGTVLVMDQEYCSGSAHRIYSKGGPANVHAESIAKTPTMADVLHCMVMDSLCVDGNTFDEFCDELGYSSDSIKDRLVYDGCQKTLRIMRPYMKELQPLFENY